MAFVHCVRVWRHYLEIQPFLALKDNSRRQREVTRFSTIDLSKGYYQVTVKEEDVNGRWHATRFRTARDAVPGWIPISPKPLIG